MGSRRAGKRVSGPDSVWQQAVVEAPERPLETAILREEFIMSTYERSVSINPYFKIKEGQMDACKQSLATFNDLVSSNESGCLFNNFTFNGDVMCCREAYVDAGAVVAHLENCGAALGEFLKVADLLRIELHGPAEELEKLKPTFADFNPEYFVYDCGIGI